MGSHAVLPDTFDITKSRYRYVERYILHISKIWGHLVEYCPRMSRIEYWKGIRVQSLVIISVKDENEMLNLLLSVLECTFLPLTNIE